MQIKHSEYVPVFKALADETRLKIVEMLSCGEMCACDLLEPFNITQPTLSYHMKILTECGLVEGKKEGSWMRYHINMDKIKMIQLLCNRIEFDQDTCICKDKKEGCLCE